MTDLPKHSSKPLCYTGSKYDKIKNSKVDLCFKIKVGNVGKVQKKSIRCGAKKVHMKKYAFIIVINPQFLPNPCQNTGSF